MGATVPTDGSGAQEIPIWAEKDGRTLAVEIWAEDTPVAEDFVARLAGIARSSGCDRALLVDLSSADDRRPTQGAPFLVWDRVRLQSELGSAVLGELFPGLVAATDPLTEALPSASTAPVMPQAGAAITLDAFEAAPAVEPTATEPAVLLDLPLGGAIDLPPVDAPAAPPEEAAAPEQESDDYELITRKPQNETVGEFKVPAAFKPPGLPVTAPSVRTQAPSANGTVQTTGGSVLAVQVGRKLARNLLKNRIRNVKEDLLRLVPYHVFAYRADLMVEGRIDAQVQEGRVAVDAAVKRVVPWSRSLETAPLNSEGAPAEEKKVRCTEEEAQKLIASHLGELIGREVTSEEDGSDWTIVVKKKVKLAGDQFEIRPLGTYWLPVWRLAGPDGSVEIDATSGEFLSQELLSEPADAELI